MGEKSYEYILGKGEHAGNKVLFVVCRYFEFGLVENFVIW